MPVPVVYCLSSGCQQDRDLEYIQRTALKYGSFYRIYRVIAYTLPPRRAPDSATRETARAGRGPGSGTRFSPD